MADSRIPYDQAIAYQSMDLSKTDLELVCGLCPIEDNPVLCDIEATDDLLTLMAVYASHWRMTHLPHIDKEN